jgi:hypothetical protein
VRGGGGWFTAGSVLQVGSDPAPVWAAQEERSGGQGERIVISRIATSGMTRQSRMRGGEKTSVNDMPTRRKSVTDALARPGFLAPTSSFRSFLTEKAGIYGHVSLEGLDKRAIEAFRPRDRFDGARIWLRRGAKKDASVSLGVLGRSVIFASCRQDMLQIHGPAAARPLPSSHGLILGR